MIWVYQLKHDNKTKTSKHLGFSKSTASVLPKLKKLFEEAGENFFVVFIKPQVLYSLNKYAIY